uniref:Reverse transcriptase domain-containing protein n=1 Tax=Oryzias latipes TaxID=8090 RepID=A0A3B3HAI8_ORYLA
MSTLRLVTWNVHGAGTREKRLKVMSKLKDLKTDFAFLQETHMSSSSVNILATADFPNVYSACYNSRQRGVTIMINREIKFTETSTVIDPEGRFIIVTLSTQNMQLCLANVYAPNVDDPKFFHSFFSALSEHTDKSLIIAGDLKMCLDPEMDRLNNTGNLRIWQSTNTVKQYMEDFGLCDVWRLFHPTKRTYTFFSTVHQSYSRLDYFLVNSSLLSIATEAQIHPITISDHAPVSLTLKNKTSPPSLRSWRFNTSLLRDPNFIDFLAKEWSSYLQNNDHPGISSCLLWEAGKAVMRGKIIAFSSHKKRKENSKLVDLEQKIRLLEETYSNSPDEQTLQQIRKVRIELNEITNQRTQFLLQRLRLERFDHSNKSGKYLANQLKINKEKTTISSVIDLTGNATHDPAAINSVFKNFYQSLYSSQINPSDNDINSFLNSIDLPRPTEEQITALESPFTKEELHKALTNMPSKKAPGPDGFPAEFYKEFWQILAPIFLRMTIEIKDNNYLPPNMNSANIILLLKPGKDPTSPSSYRPISLINADLKIICKALAGRLEKVVPSLIHPDQTGFINGRHSSTNMRRLINLIDYTTINNREATILSLDAEKAFDRVNWKFLIATLNKFGFGKSFINWIKILYASPNARIRTNDQTSPSFNLQRGTRQGCPLSPSLFALFIEPLAAAIRQSRDIEGIQTKNLEHKISLYADDVLLFTPNSQSSICQIISLINRFSSVSEYSINWSKSTILPINCNYLNPSSIKIQTGNIKYLGINISCRLSDLLKLNHTQLLKTTEADLTRWKTLPISLIGRVAAIKMMILPKINYLFSMIPSKPPTTWFKSLDSFISQYLWEGKPPRISLKTIKKPKDRGGLGLPDFQDYYSANRLCYVQKWLNPGVLDESWLDIEQNLCDNLDISNLPFFSSKIKQHKCFRSLNISSSLTAWWDFLKKNNLTLFPCKLTPIWNNPDILINKNMIHFASWKNKGIEQFQHIIQNRKFMSLSTLSSTYGININKFLEYQQLKSAISTKYCLTQIDLDPPLTVTHFMDL